jgi:phage shock protein PspC (stress-responsive transcriptional regulator)
MRKVTTINLNNNAYQIDEDGFDALRNYLDNAARALASNPDREEILSDLEQAIADKCRLTLGPHKTVVSVGEIERILQEMGPVAGSAEEAAAGTADASGQAGPASGGSPGASGYRPRRLYRINEGRKWAGICQGLAAYADVDVSLVRLAMILLTVFTGFFPCLFLYVVMCFVLPVATTPEEMAAAHGQPFRAQELVDRVKKKHDEFRSTRREKRRMRHAAWWSNQPAPQPPPGYAARLTGGVLLPVLTVLSAVWFAAMAIAALVVWLGWHHVAMDYWPPGPWQYHADFPRWIALAAIIAAYALLAIPIGAGRRAAMYYANGGRRHGWADAWSGLLWIMLVAVLVLVAWHELPQLDDLLRGHAHGSRTVINL